VLQVPSTRMFRLARAAISCERDGLSVGGVRLLECEESGQRSWRLRPIADLNLELSATYGLPVDIASKAAGLAGVAEALDRGDLALAQIASLCLQFPDPPDLQKSARSNEDMEALAAQLFWSGLLKGDWDELEHPRLGGPPNAGWFVSTPKEPKLPRAGWPSKAVNRKIRERIAEITLARAAGVTAHLAPFFDVVAFVIDALTASELNEGEDRITAQIKANFDPPKTLEELQTPPADTLGYEQHHIVERNKDNVAKNGDEPIEPLDKFGSAAIEDPSNIVWVPRLKHEKITADYNSIYEGGSDDDESGSDDEGGGDASQPIKRRVINQKSFEDQRAAGLEALRKYGVLK
jgi:hypothetical protein